MANQELDNVQGSNPEDRLYYPTNIGGPTVDAGIPTSVNTGDNSEGRLTDLQKAIKIGFGAEDTTDYSYETSNVSKKYPVTFKGIDNEELYAQDQDWTDKALNSLGKGLLLTGTTFLQGTVGLVNGIVAAGQDGRLASFYDNDFNKSVDAINKKAEEEWMPNYESQAYRDASWYSPSKIFTANFLFEGIIKNLGFAAGAALSGGVYSAALRSLPLTSRLFSIGKSADAIAATEQGLLAANKLASTYGKVKSLSDKFLSSYNLLSPAGRITVAGLSTIGEASIEAYHNLNDFRTNAINEYKNQHFGLAPTGDDLTRINELADSTGNYSFLYNTILLTGTNYIQFPKILGSSAKLEKSIIDDVSREIRDVVKDETGKYVIATATSRAGKLLSKINKISPYIFAPSEGFEEGAQYAIQIGTQDYYNKKNKNNATSFIDSLTEGIKAVGTNEGMENVLIGGLSGALMMAKGTHSERKEINKATGEAVTSFNTSHLSDFTKSTKDAINRGVTIQEDRETRLRQGDIIESKDLEADYIINYLTPRIMFNRFDLVKSDIEEYKRTAQTEEGFSQLQAEGKVLEGDKREAYLQRLDNLETTADNMSSLYQSLNLRYASKVDAKGDRLYSKEVMEKMLYAATKVTDYDTRIPQLTNKLISSVPLVFDTLDQLVKGDGGAFNKAMEDIDGLDVLSEVKDELKQNLKDLGDIVLRRQMFFKEYDDIKNDPSKYTTPETAVIDETIPKKTVSVKTKDGDEELEVGTEYYAGAKRIEVEEGGGTIAKYSKFTLLGETEDGESIKILLPNKTTMIVKKSALEQYKLGKVADTDKRENAKFFIETTDHIFTYNLGKGKNVKGTLAYDKTTDKLTFISLDGKFQRPVTRDQFNPKPGFNVAQIYSNKKFTPKADAAVKAEVDAAEKLSTRNKIIVDLYNTSKKRLDEITATLEKNKNKLSGIEEDLANVTNTAANIPRKRLTKAITKTINELSKIRQDIETQNTQLQVEKEELEATLPYFQDMSENLGEFESTGQAVLDDLKEDINALEEMISHTGDAIKQGSVLIKSIDNALQAALSIFNDFVKRVKEENPNVPFLLSDFQDRLEKYLGEEGAKNFITDKLGFTELVLELEQSIGDFSKELNISGMESKFQKLQEQIKELSTGLDDLINEQMAKAKVLEAFEQYAENYKKQQEEEKRLIKDSKLRQEFLGINDVDVQNEISTAKSYEPDSKKDWWEVLGSTIATLFAGKDHQLRADRFGNRFYKISKDIPIKGVIVNIDTQEFIVPGLMEHLAGTSGVDPKNTVALVMVQVNEDGTFTPVDEFGKPIPEGAILVDSAIYQVFPAKELMQQYSGGRESMFRDEIANNKDVRVALEKQYDAWRNEQLAQKTLGAPREIVASFGHVDYVKIKNTEGKEVIDYNAQTGVIEAGLVTDADLIVESVVTVATTNDSVSNGSVTFNTPLGRVLLKVPGGLVKLLNRKFNNKEANLIVDVLHQVAQNSFDDKTIKTDRTQKLISWLKSVGYWGIAKNTQTHQRKKAGYNNFWFEEVVDETGDSSTQLFVSGKGGSFDFTPSSIEANRNELITLFTAMYNNANATMLNKKAFNNPYFELTGLNADGTPIFKEWKNYQMFLLSSKDRKKGEIPFTTAFKPIKGDNEFNRTFIYFTLADTQNVYTFPQPKAVIKQTPVNKAAPVAAPVATQKEVAPEGYKLDGTTPNLMELNSGPVTFTLNMVKFITSGGDILASDFNVTPTSDTLSIVTVKKKGDIKAAEKLIRDTVYTRLKPILDEALVPSEVPTTDVSEENQIAFDEEPINVPDDEVYRLQVENEVSSFDKEDWTAVEKWLKQFLPNVPVYRVKNIIKATNGKQAWGMFRKGAIYIYENAQVGTAYHEVFHAIMNMFTDANERKLIFSEFKNRKGTFTALDESLNDITIKFSEASDKQIEEQLAEEFKDYVLTRKVNKPESGRPAILKFFADLFNTIKEFFLGVNASANTEMLFEKISSGYYKTVIPYEYNLGLAENNIIDIDNVRVTKDSMFSVARVPQTQVHEIMEHMTYSVLSKLSNDNKSLFIASTTLNKTNEYDRLKTEILDLLRWKKSIVKDAVAKANYEILHNNVKEQWNSIKKKHIEYLKTYSVEFDENDESIIRDEEASGKADWQDARKMDDFKKINATIKLAIGTLPIMEMLADGSLKPVRSSIGGMKLMPLDKSYITLINRLHTSINFDQMMVKLRDLSLENPTYATLYKRLTKRSAITPGINYDALTDTYHAQFIAGFWRAFKKQKPSVQIVFILPSGEVIVSDSALSTAASQERSNMASSLISSIRLGNPYIKYDTTKKEYTSQAGITNYKLVSDKIETYTEFLKKFGIEFDPKQLRAKLKSNQLTIFKDAVEGLKNSLTQLSDVKTLTTKTLAIDGRLLELGTIKAILENPEFESTYFNLNGDRVQTYMGTNLLSDMYDVISNITNYNRLESSKYARLTTDAFSKGSAILNRMFNITGEDADGRRISDTEDLMKTAFADGYVNEQTNKKKESARLNLKERTTQEINLNLKGFYMNLVPGDASIEWMVNLGQFVSLNTFKSKGYEAIHEIFKEYFISEVNVAREDRPIVQDITNSRKSTDLRFFKSILSKEDHAAIVKMLSSKKSAEQIYKVFNANIKNAVKNKVETEAKSSKATLNKYGVIETNEEGELTTEGIAFEGYDGMTDAQLNLQLEVLAANYMMANIELHKLVYSDPYQYKDELKRIKSFNSPHQPLLANSPGINAMLDRVYNKGFDADDKIGHTDFIRDFFRSITLSDVVSKSELKDYGVFEETDGGGYISMKANRNLRERAGQWNDLEEEQFRFDVEFEKAVKAKASGKDMAELMKKNPNIRSAYTPIKPIVAGDKQDGNNWNDVVLDKFALFPLSFRLLHELNPTSNAINLYNKMQRDDVDYAVYATGRKVGAKTPVNLYNADGKFNDAVINEPENVSNIPFDILSIQAEVPSKDTHDTTQGSQITKLVTMDLMAAGVPVDFEPSITDMDDRFAAWLALEDKASYNNGDNLYNDILTNRRILEEKINHGFNTLVDMLGIVRTDKGIELKYKKKLIDTLKNEIYKREINDNIIEAFDNFEEGQVILEATPAYQQIRNILYSIADRNISSQKINGGLKVQVPVTLLESVRAKVDPKTGAYVSDELKMYEKDGERVCEIMVARWFDTTMTDEELKEFFDGAEGQELLRGIAYRVPTQSQNSIDVFKIAKFLPRGYGDTVIIPSALVRKVGSDFDIDKLSIYLKNIYKDASGKIRMVPFHGFGEDAKAKFGELFDTITKDKKELTETKITKLSGLQELLGNILLDNASDKQMAKWIPIFKNMFGEDMSATDVEQALMLRLEKAGKDVDKLNDADLQAALKQEFIEKMYGKSLENAYIASLQKLITNPANFDQLIQPNDAQLLKDLAYEINDKLGIAQVDYSSTGNMLSRGFMTELRQDFVSGKQAIGIAAIANTNHAENQRSLITLDPAREISSEDRKYIQDGDIKLPHNQITVNGEKRATLSMINDVLGKPISDIIGMFIDGYVDISKGPWIMQLGARLNTASTWLFLTKIGVPIKTTAYFMNQPIIKQYLQTIENQGYSWLFIDPIINDTKDLFYVADDVYTSDMPNETGLGKMVGKSFDKLSPLQNAQQHLILDEFLKYAKMSDHLFKVQQATSFDTASFNDPVLIFKKNEQIKIARKTIISSVDDLLNNSFVGYLREVLGDVGEAYSDVLISEKPRVKETINTILKDYIHLNDRDFVVFARKTINNLFDWATQIDKKINLTLSTILLGTDTQQSAAEELMKFKISVLNTPNHPLRDNIIIKALQMKKGGKEGVPDNLYLTAKDSKTYNQNQIIFGFMELKNSIPKQLYGKLVRVAIMQSGLTNSAISFSSLLPYEDFKNIYNDTLNKLEEMPNLADFIDLNVMERTLYNDANVVPSKKAKWIKTKKGKWMYGLETKFLSKKLQKAIDNKEIPQTINISKLSREGASDIITYTWENQSISKANKAQMRKKGDYSYINRGLFKKVYDDIGDPIIYISTAKSGIIYESYIYKAINTWGDSYRANEFYGKMFPDDASSTLSQQGVFDNGYIKVDEVEDGVIEDIMGDDAVSKLNITTKEDDKLREELVVPLQPMKAVNKTISNNINIYAGTGENAELSNFANRPTTDPLGTTYNTVEGAFQAAKLNYATGDNSDIDIKLQTATGAQSRELGQNIKGLNISNWDENSTQILKSIMKESFIENPKALKTLLDTNNSKLTHKNKAGVEQDKGRFSKLLMEIREELKQEDDKDPFKC